MTKIDAVLRAHPSIDSARLFSSSERFSRGLDEKNILSKSEASEAGKELKNSVFSVGTVETFLFVPF